MSRKLRFFKDQIDKAGLRCSPRHELEPDIELGDLEVRIQFSESASPNWGMRRDFVYDTFSFFVSSIAFFGRDNLLIMSMRYWK